MGISVNIRRDKVSSLRRREPILVKPTATVKQAAAKMRAKRLGCVIVIDSKGRPVGKFTEHLLIRLMLSKPKALTEPISKHMYKNADCIALSDPVAKMVRIMKQKEIRHLCALDTKGKVVGLTGQSSLIEYIADYFPRQVKVQRVSAVLSMEKAEGG